DNHTTYIYTLSLHDALPIYCLLFDRQPRGYRSPRIRWSPRNPRNPRTCWKCWTEWGIRILRSNWIPWRSWSYRRDRFRGSSWSKDRKSTRLNSSHDQISYAV